MTASFLFVVFVERTKDCGAEGTYGFSEEVWERKGGPEFIESYLDFDGIHKAFVSTVNALNNFRWALEPSTGSSPILYLADGYVTLQYINSHVTSHKLIQKTMRKIRWQ